MKDDLPRGWQYKALRDLATINYGKSPTSILSDDGDIPVVGTGGTERYGIGFLYDGQSIILGRKGTIDKVAFVDGKFWVIDTAYYLSDFQSLDIGWLYFFLQTVDFRLLNEATGVPSLSREILYKFPIPTPPADEQPKIAAILSTLDKAIEQTETLIAKHQRIKTGLMQDLLTKGIDENGNIRSEATHEFKDSPLGRIPVEWDVFPCEVLCREIIVGIVIRPAQYYKPSGVPVLRSANVRENQITHDNLVFMSEEDNQRLRKSRLTKGDLVTVRTGYPGTTAVIPEGMHGVNCVDIVISRPDTEKVRANYLSIWVNSGFGKKQVLEGQGGLAQQHFNVGQMRKLLVKTPSLCEQNSIEDVLSSQAEYMSKFTDQLDKLKREKVGLMHDLLTGKVRVTELLDSTGLQA